LPPPAARRSYEHDGRKRSVITDMLALFLVVVVLVTTAGVRDFVAGTQLLDQGAADHPAIRKDWAGGGCRTHFTGHAATLGTDLKIVQRTPGARGFTPIPKRWTVERTYGRLMLNRRLPRYDETRPHRSEPMIHLAMSDLMARRLTGESTISWRTPVKPHPSQIPGGNNERKRPLTQRQPSSGATWVRMLSSTWAL
jgi:transposase